MKYTIHATPERFRKTAGCPCMDSEHNIFETYVDAAKFHNVGVHTAGNINMFFKSKTLNKRVGIYSISQVAYENWELFDGHHDAELTEKLRMEDDLLENYLAKGIHATIGGWMGDDVINICWKNSGGIWTSNDPRTGGYFIKKEQDKDIKIFKKFYGIKD